MFNTFSLKNSRPVTKVQAQKFHELLEIYSRSKQGQWLTEIPYHQFKILWCDAMTLDSGIMGAFVPWIGRKVFLMPNDPPMIKNMSDPWLEQIAPTLVHELRHAWQYKKYGLLYILCCLPGLRKFTLEKDAWRITEKAEKFFSAIERRTCAAKLL